MNDTATPTAYSYIRFSTPEQMDGDSLRRQMESSIAYAKEQGLTLDTALNLRDLGVSAFRGANVEKGRLGAFIKAIESGLVANGSYLLVESLDRLSRAEVMDALEVFLAIVNRGVTIVTLLDKREYSRESLRESSTELIISIVIMSRAYDESVTKSKRRHLTWNQQKRVAATSGAKMTKKLPFWLSLPDPKGEFVIIDEAAAVVRRVFELAKAGFGFSKITQALNADGVPSPAARNYTKKQKYKDNPRTWATSSVGYLLRNEAVIGNLVMTEVTPEKEEAPVPSRLDGYYPRIIDDETFFSIQGKRQPPRGKASALKLNLFTGLLFCGYCGGPAQVDTNTKETYRRSRISCQRRRRGLGCVCKTWSYEEFEEDFFTFIHEVDLGSIVQPNKQNSALSDEIAVLSGLVAVNNVKLKKLIAEFINDEGSPIQIAKSVMRELESENVKLESELRAKRVLLDAERNYRVRAEREIDAIRGHVTMLNQLPSNERVVVRYSLAEHIASVVESIHLLPNGSLLQSSDLAPDEEDPDDDETGWGPIDTTPYFIVKFRNGWSCNVKPSTDQARRFDKRETEMIDSLLRATLTDRDEH